MKSLLDLYRPVPGFQPLTVTDVFALRLARKLGDAPAVRHYAELTADHSDAQLIATYRRALRVNGPIDLGRRFHAELRRSPASTHDDSSSSLIAIRVDRRTVAVAIFHGTHLEYVDARQLSSDHAKAVSSATGFIRWVVSRFSTESSALESIPDRKEILRRTLHESISATLRDQMLSIWEIPRSELLENFGYPTLKTREQLREVAISIWPILNGNHARVFMRDAAILGLHVQTERLFIIDHNFS